jgi:hypothetical protein
MSVARAMQRSTAAAAPRARKRPRAAGWCLAAVADPTTTASPRSGSRCPSSAAVMVITASYQVTALEERVLERALGRSASACAGGIPGNHKPRTRSSVSAETTCCTSGPVGSSTGQQQHKPSRLGGAAVDHSVASTPSVAVSDDSQRCGVCAGYRNHIPRKESAVIPICLGVCGVFGVPFARV